MRVLAGDIGGTNARLAVFHVEDGAYRQELSEKYPSPDYSSLDEILDHFVKDNAVRCDRACFGIAGPVDGDRVDATNLPWTIEASRLADVAGVESATLLNDLEAQAYGIAVLQPEDFVVLHPGRPDAVGNAALIAAGTGLGQAGLYWDGHEHRPFACEGGHASFAPSDELQVALLGYLSEKFGHVSWERVLSGPGFVSIHDFFIDYRRADASSEHVQPMRKEDPSAITEAAREGRCPFCVAAMDLFVRLYGAEAGNLALKFLARGGLYVSGGIAPRIIEFLRRPAFVEAFLDKGRMRDLLEQIPVKVIVNAETALLGAARYAVSRDGSQ